MSLMSICCNMYANCEEQICRAAAVGDVVSYFRLSIGGAHFLRKKKTLFAVH